MMSVSTHLPPKEMCLCVKELVGKKKKRNKYGKKICEHGIEDSIWPTEKTETHLTKKTKVQHLSPLCHLQAQANKYTTCAAKYWVPKTVWRRSQTDGIWPR